MPELVARSTAGTDRIRHREAARKIWEHAAAPFHTLAHRYLWIRGIRDDPPAALRFHPSLFHHSDASRDYYFPALIACAEDTAGHFAGIQRTWLDSTRTDLKLQLEPRKAALGTEAGSIIRLSPYLNSTIVLCEGVEDGLSIIQATGETVWATLGTNMSAVQLPEVVTTVILAGDNDSAGQSAIERAARHFHADGRMVRIVFPPPGTKDFNDSLRSKS